MLFLAPSPVTITAPSISRALITSANSAGSTCTPAASPNRLATSEYLTTCPPLVISSSRRITASFMSALRWRSAALVPSVNKLMSMRPWLSVAAVLSADLMRRTASRTSSRVTV